MYITIDKIAEFLTSKSRVCLTINGHWGIGKTHLWKQVEEKINADKKVVYIDLLAKKAISKY
ncbi:P-loop NTPase fold protein [Campylobacter coli]